MSEPTYRNQWARVDAANEPPHGSEVRWRSEDGEEWVRVWDASWVATWAEYCSDDFPFEAYRAPIAEGREVSDE
jgi:hypothetical protein